MHAPDYDYPAATLRRPGGDLAYVDVGTGDPVVFVHGNPTWGFHFRALVNDLKRDHRCIAIDHLGCGRSAKPTLDQYDFKLKSRVDDLEALLDSLGVSENVTLVVHDWGGMIGCAWAARHPRRLKRLICLNTGAFPLPAAKPMPWSLRLGRSTRLGAWLILKRNLFCKLAAKWCVARRPLPPAVRAAYLEPHDTPAHRLSVLQFVQTIPLSEADEGFGIVRSTGEALGRFGVPTLLLWGLKDFVFDRHFLDEFRRRVPHAEWRAWGDCGHYLLEDAPGEVVAAAREFLGRHAVG